MNFIKLKLTTLVLSLLISQVPSNLGPRVIKEKQAPIIYETYQENYNIGNKLNMEEFRNEFLKLVNAERESKHLWPLSYSKYLKLGTEIRTNELADFGYISTGKNYDNPHKRLDGKNEFRTAFDYLPDYKNNTGNQLGENLLCFGFATFEDKYLKNEDKSYINYINGKKSEMEDAKKLAKLCFDNWKESEGHYRNIIEPLYKTMYLDIRMSKPMNNFGPQKSKYKMQMFVITNIFDINTEDYYEKIINNKNKGK